MAPSSNTPAPLTLEREPLAVPCLELPDVLLALWPLDTGFPSATLGRLLAILPVAPCSEPSPGG